MLLVNGEIKRHCTIPAREDERAHLSGALWTTQRRAHNLAPSPTLRGLEMIETKLLDDLARRLAAAMPSRLTAFQQDIEKNLRAGLEAVFQRLDLVTREEYEVQVALLARSRERLAALEARLAELEVQAKPLNAPAAEDGG